MSTSTPVNRRILFARWPVGAPVPEDFKTVSEPLPSANLGQGFIFFDHYETRYADFARDMGIWVRDGKIKYREEVLDGLERAPNGLMGMLRGDNFGKLIVKVADG
jgi:NADPH-dependent curcumin reductase CurA